MVGMTQIPGPVTGPPQNTGAAPSGLDRFFDWLRSLDVRRYTDDKWLAGVCSGLSNRLGVDRLVVRAALVLLVLLGGIGITLYLIAWAFLPNGRGEILAERAVREGAVGPIILLVIVVLSLLGGGGFAHDGPGLVWLWWLVLGGLVVWMVTRHRAQPAQPAPPAQPTPPAQPAPAAQSTQAYAATAPAVGATAPFVGATAPFNAAPATVPPAGGPGVPPPPPFAIAPRPPRVPRPPRRRSAGFTGAVLVSGLALAAYGLALWGHDTFGWRGNGDVVALASALGVTGLGLLGFGLAGRRAGLLGFIAVVLAISTWTASVVPNLSLGGGVGDRVWRPSATDTTSRYRLGAGSAELDLTSLPSSTGTPRVIDAGIGVGELRIRIPADHTVEVRSSVSAGDIAQWHPGSLDPSADTTNSRGGRNLSTVETFGTGPTDVVVTAHVGLGQILIGKE